MDPRQIENSIYLCDRLLDDFRDGKENINKCVGERIVEEYTRLMEANIDQLRSIRKYLVLLQQSTPQL